MIPDASDSDLIDSDRVDEVTASRQLGRTLGVALIVVVSLLSFPSVLPWMIGVWVLWHSVLVFLNQPAWLPLSACAAMLVIKLVPHTPLLVLLGILFATIGVLRYRRRADPVKLSRWRFAFFVIPWIAWGAMFWEHQSVVTCNQPRYAMPDATQRIVCVGDSLTDGMLPDHGFPAALAKILSTPVVNEGVSGIATSQGLSMMPRVLAHRPSIVVIELGGHDFLKGHTRAATKANLIRMIDLCREHYAEVVLLEIPRGFIFDPFASLEREIAYEQDVELVADTWLRQIVLLSPIAPPGMWMQESSRLSDDGIHSNPRGSQAIAERVALSIKALQSRRQTVSFEQPK